MTPNFVPSTTIQTGLLDLISNSGLAAKAVLLVLAIGSVVSWGIIFAKWVELRLIDRQNAKFLNLFWHGKNLDEIFSKAERMNRSSIATLFRSGFRELKKLPTVEPGSEAVSHEMENIQRALLRSSQAETHLMEHYLPWLATTASAAPFIGLFGTVWGIMNSFQSIGATGSANLAVVAPGISEALITTAVGLATAIPAVIAYNHFIGRIQRVTVDMDCFSQDLLNIVQRSFLSRKKSRGESQTDRTIETTEQNT